ncbi:transposase [Marinomonas algarum]|uniref:transposase n=1 Tax=Marinomonas algarum TaxID=2883105 RepID=UPI003B8385FF
MIAEIPRKIRLLRKHTRINRLPIQIEHIKASIRANVEPPFRIIKRQFGFKKTIYRGLKQNDNKLAMLFTLTKVFRIDQMIRITRDKFVQKPLNETK